jgi:hypothetical protein
MVATETTRFSRLLQNSRGPVAKEREYSAKDAIIASFRCGGGASRVGEVA